MPAWQVQDPEFKSQYCPFLPPEKKKKTYGRNFARLHDINLSPWH
jgi:hypothetical protein